MFRCILPLRYHCVDIMIMPAIKILPPILGMNNGPILGTKPCTGLLYCNNRHLCRGRNNTEKSIQRDGERLNEFLDTLLFFIMPVIDNLPMPRQDK